MYLYIYIHAHTYIHTSIHTYILTLSKGGYLSKDKEILEFTNFRNKNGSPNIIDSVYILSIKITRQLLISLNL